MSETPNPPRGGKKRFRRPRTKPAINNKYFIKKYMSTNAIMNRALKRIQRTDRKEEE